MCGAVLVVKGSMETFVSSASANQEEGVDLSKKEFLKKIIFTGFVFICLFAPAMTLAGSSPVVTVGDSSSGGAINFEPIDGTVGAGGDSIATDIAAGGSISVEVSPGNAVTVTSKETAVNSGALGQDQIASVLGVGGIAVTLSEKMAESVSTAAMSPSVLVDGEAMTPLEVLQSLSTALNLSGLVVTMPSGVDVAVSSIVSNTAMALTGNDLTLTGTALNDAAIVMSQTLKSGADLSVIRSVAEAIAVLLDAARNPSV